MGAWGEREPIRRSGWSSDERVKVESTHLTHQDRQLLGLADYSATPRVDGLTGKEIAALRRRLSAERKRLGIVTRAIDELERQISRALDSGEED